MFLLLPAIWLFFQISTLASPTFVSLECVKTITAQLENQAKILKVEADQAIEISKYTPLRSDSLKIFSATLAEVSGILHEFQDSMFSLSPEPVSSEIQTISDKLSSEFQPKVLGTVSRFIKNAPDFQKRLVSFSKVIKSECHFPKG